MTKKIFTCQDNWIRGGTFDAPAFPTGWRPVSFDPSLAAWEIAPRWHAPVWIAMAFLHHGLRNVLARLLYLAARALEVRPS